MKSYDIEDILNVDPEDEFDQIYEKYIDGNASCNLYKAELKHFFNWLKKYQESPQP